jgi:putative membrane protein
MLWIESIRIILVTSGFAGLFCLPRILVNLAMVDPARRAIRASAGGRTLRTCSFAR